MDRRPAAEETSLPYHNGRVDESRWPHGDFFGEDLAKTPFDDNQTAWP